MICYGIVLFIWHCFSYGIVLFIWHCSVYMECFVHMALLCSIILFISHSFVHIALFVDMALFCSYEWLCQRPLQEREVGSQKHQHW